MSANTNHNARKWTLGIFNDGLGHDVHGTVLFSQATHDKPTTKPSTDSSNVHSPEERPSTSKRTPDGKTVLIPQPSDYPNDPLNWPEWRRNLALAALGFFCMLGGGLTPIIASGFHDIAIAYDISEDRVPLTTGFYMLGLGVGGVILNPTAMIFGKRPVYLVAAVFLIFASTWCALAPSFKMLLIGRTLQGLAISSVEVLPSSTITEIFFLHERAFKLGLYTMLILCGKNLSPTLSSVVIYNKNWRFVFWVAVIAASLASFLVLFFLPETHWDRSVPCDAHDMRDKHDIKDIGTGSSSTDSTKTEITVVDQIKAEEPQATTLKTVDKTVDKTGPSPVHNNVIPQNVDVYTQRMSEIPRQKFMQTIKPWNGIIRPGNWGRIALRPFILYCYPSILWSALCYALSMGWLILMSEVMDNVYRKKPYNFSEIQVGLVYISPFIGAVLGSALAGKLSDIICKAMAARNDGVFEPEFRLVMTPFITISTAGGLMAFGWSVREHDTWIIPTFFFCVISFGCSLGYTTAITFCIDSFKEYSGEALVTLNFTKNILHGLIFSMIIGKWVRDAGIKKVFLTIGGMQLGCMMLSIPMYIYGKKAREWASKKNLAGRW